MEHSGDGYFEVDLKGSFTFANAAACRFIGRPLAELIGLNFRAIMTPEQAERNFKLYNDVYRTGRPSPLIEYEIIRKDGSPAINETTVVLLRDAQGAPIGFCGMVRDRTEMRRLERILAQSEEKHRSILANMEEGYYETDLAGRFTDVNAAACKSLGYDQQELRGMNFRECLDAETAQRVFELFNEVYRTGQPAHIFECKLISQDGAVRTHEISVSLLKNASGAPIGFFGISRDRTEQMQMQRDLRESEESYRRVLELAPDAVAIHDARTMKYIQINAAFCQHTGHTLEAVIGRTPDEIKLFAFPEDQRKIEALLATERKIDGLEVTFQSKSGQRFEDLLSARMIHFKGKVCALFVATVITPLKQAQAALRESERRYRDILEAAPDPICLTTLAEGRYLAANSAFYQTTGYTPEETIGRTSRELGIYTDPAHRDRFLRALQEKGRVDGLEMAVRFKDGSVSAQLWSARTIVQDGQACILVSGKSIDELKAAQQAVADSEESYRRIMELAPDMIVITRVADGRIVAVNDTFCARTGFSRKEALGRTPLELGLYTDLDSRRRWLEMLRREGQVRGLELQFRTRDGVLQDDLFSAQYIRFKGEDCILAVITSISKLKQIQRSLEEREENQRTLLDTAPYAITIVRQADLRYLQVNKSFCSNTGYGPDEVIGHTSEELHLFVDPGDRQRMAEGLTRHGRIDGLEIQIRKSDGTILETLVSSRPVQFEGQPCLLFISADISALKATQRELERYHKSLEQMVADRTRELEAAQGELVKRERLAVLGQLTATVSHELRNPLGVIRSSNFYLQRRNQDTEEKTLKHFRRIDEQVTLCDTIVADLLEYTRGRSTNMVRQALGSWLPQVVEQMQEAWALEIGLRLSKDLPPWSHDQEKMRRVIINVLDNALQAVHAREKELKGDPGYQPSVSLEAAKQADSVVLRCIDNGIGMDAQTCRRAFEPLFTTRARGTGIGLANVKKIVDEHGGRIELQSCPGQGTRISIFLPLTVAGQA
jgi:PAS domain S-box-containing protein